MNAEMRTPNRYGGKMDKKGFTTGRICATGHKKEHLGSAPKPF